MAARPRLRGANGRFVGAGQAAGGSGSASITIEIDASAARRSIEGFAERGLADLMEILGTLVENQTKRRIAVEKRSPDGAAWAPLSPLTRMARRGGGSGQLTDTGRLLGSISHTSSSTSATVGTNVFYAPFHQYGVKSIKPKKGKFLRVPLGGGGGAFLRASSIPARPFMGVSAENMAQIRRAIDAWVGEQFG